MKRVPLTSREIMGVIAAMRETEGKRLIKEYITRLHDALDDTDDMDMLGTEGWRKYLLREDF